MPLCARDGCGNEFDRKPSKKYCGRECAEADWRAKHDAERDIERAMSSRSRRTTLRACACLCSG